MEDKDSKLDLYNSLPSKDEAFGKAMPWSDGRPVNFLKKTLFKTIKYSITRYFFSKLFRDIKKFMKAKTITNFLFIKIIVQLRRG